MTMEDIPQLPGPTLGVSLVGSVAIYGTGADTDYIVLVSNQCEWALDAVQVASWRYDGNYSNPDAEFTSLRKDGVNLIVTDKPWLFESFLIATDIMRRIAHIAPQHDKIKRVIMYELLRQWCKEAHCEPIL